MELLSTSYIEVRNNKQRRLMMACRALKNDLRQYRGTITGGLPVIVRFEFVHAVYLHAEDLHMHARKNYATVEVHHYTYYFFFLC